MQRWEVNAVDMLALAEDFPNSVMMGGIYKHIFEPGHPARVGRLQTDDVRKAIDGNWRALSLPCGRAEDLLPVSTMPRPLGGRTRSSRDTAAT